MDCFYIRRDCLAREELTAKKLKIMAEDTTNKERVLKKKDNVAATGMVNMADLQRSVEGGIVSSVLIDTFFQKMSSHMSNSVNCVISFVYPCL